MQRTLRITAFVIVSAGLALLAPGLYFELQSRPTSTQRNFTPVEAPLSTSPTVISGKPVRIEIPSLEINLPIADGNYDAQSDSWTLSDDKAHFALPTSRPNNEAGNTLVYGHNTREVFESLPKLTSGAEVLIFTENGLRFRYTYVSTSTVAPTDTAIFDYQGKPRLTLQTCTGLWSQSRQFFFFDLKDVK